VGAIGSGDCVKLEIPLSAEVSVLVLFDGGIPDARAFERLREALAVLQRALVEEVKAEQPKVPENPKRERKLRSLPPCEKHPTSGRHSSTNRCLACLSENAQRMLIARRATA